MTWFRVWAVVVLLLSCAVSAAETLRTEDIVRLFVSGASPKALIERIEQATVEFDTDEEMLDELRLAGIPDEVIRAMVARQAKLDSENAPADPAAEDAEPDGPLLRVRLNPDWEPKEDRTRPRIRVLNEIDTPLIEQLGLRASEDAMFTGLALYLACTTADHVPDHWRGKSPLGRDFNSMPRHRMLVFLADFDEVPVGKTKDFLRKLGHVGGARDGLAPWQILQLELPERIETPIEVGVTHDLVLGVALEAGGRYYHVAGATWDGIVPADPPSELAARVVSGRNLTPGELSVDAQELDADE
ncbi:MAG: hypothetical protein GY716_16960 [bacterium]|nr:hypothetical protein [bacterium]